MVLNALVEVPVGLVAHEAFDVFGRRHAAFLFIPYGFFVGLYLVLDVLFVGTLDSLKWILLLGEFLVVLVASDDVQEVLIHHVDADWQDVAEHVAHEFFVFENDHVLIRGSLLQRALPLARLVEARVEIMDDYGWKLSNLFVIDNVAIVHKCLE